LIAPRTLTHINGIVICSSRPHSSSA